MMRARVRPLAGWVICGALFVLVLAGWPAAGPAAGSPPPPLPGGAPAMPTMAAAPDTAALSFGAVDSLPAPLRFHVLADSVVFGGLLAVAWDLPAGRDAAATSLPTVAGDEVVLEPEPRPRWRPFGGRPRDEETSRAVAALPTATGERVVARYRIYRTGPFRLEWAGTSSAVVTVRGRVDDPGKLAAIRDPRALSWFTPALAVLLAACVLVAALIWWWWRRRTRGAEPPDWPLPEPAWIGTALALQRLLGERHLERGEARPFLDGLAAVARRHAAGHYGVPAAEMTGRELVDACEARGFEAALPEALARLIDAADLHRYDPQESAPEWCRAEAVALLTCLAETRVMPRQTPVAPERLLAAGRAWAEVSAELTAARGTARHGGGAR